MKLKEIISAFDEFAPFILQEGYDNSGLQTGSPDTEINGAVLCVDVTEEVINEAIQKGVNLVISHHPLIFSGIKSLTGKTYTERIIISALKNDIAILSVHTNIDNAAEGVSSRICAELGMKDLKVLDPVKNALVKLVFFVPADHAEKVRESIFEAGAGVIGNYDMCSFNTSGDGTFRASENTDPFVGEKGKFHTEKEIRVETIMPASITDRVVTSLIKSHPYEEVAYDLYPLANIYKKAGAGLTGQLPEEMSEMDFLRLLKQKFKAGMIRHTGLTGRKVRKVAVCGGSGSYLLGKAIAAGADVFVSGDFKYHQFFDAEKRILIADIGHYESEQFTKELFYELLIKKYPTFALYLSEVNTNPINYL
jgi:dinuclear metal center YbgI/SA1388 family protein